MAHALDNFLFTYQSLLYALGVNALLALSMYVVLAVGQLSLGQAAFMGVGAYASALLSVKFGVPFPVALLASALTPAALAYVIGAPTLRLSGVYLAIATIGLGEVLRILYLNWDYAGGALGLNGIPEEAGFLWIYGTLVVAIAAFIAVARSRIGRAMEAIRADEAAAGVMGVNLPAYKLGALVASAAIAGVAGAFNAHVSSFIGPNEYGFDAAVTILSFALLGGIGSPLGPVLGALVLTALPEILRPLHDYRLVINGLIIVLVVIFLPEGVLRWRIRRIGARV
ncbi:MAG: branched-chain amino acid ABC transporter permease [Hyphomicrobiales bacterium]|nr:branched-chain amino acid ABC transporter permease [Hyphomicrobiales bacterium]